MNDKINDKNNILIKNNKNFYHTFELREESCCFCKDNFEYSMHGNKRTFNKKDFIFYGFCVENKKYYIHPCCFVDFINDNYTHDNIYYIGCKIKTIYLYDRFGVKLYKKNYVCGVKKILDDYYLMKFINNKKTQNCFKIWHSRGHMGYPTGPIQCVFIANKLSEFKEIKKQFNIEISPENTEILIKKHYPT